MPDHAVAIVRAASEATTRSLDRALDRIGLRERLAAGIATRDAFAVVVVPALDAFAADSPALADPRLVEHLIDALFDLGAARVDIGSTRDSSALWLDNRDPFIVADLLGYRYETPKGRAYDVIDLAEDLVEDAFPGPGPLAGTPLSRAWLEADLRVVVAANRTDEDDGYALCLSTLLSVLPLTDKDHHYRRRRDPGEVVAALLGRAPVALAVIEAGVSAHGPGGGRAPAAIATATIVAATDPVLADHHGAVLMGLDPFVSRTAAPSLAGSGLLEGVVTTGALDPYPGWINVDPLLVASVKARRRSGAIDRSVRPLLQRVDRDLFPFSHPANDRVNAVAAPLFDGADGGRPLALLNHWLAQLGAAQRAWATHYGKDSLSRIDAPVNIDPASVPASAFDAIAGELLPLTELLRGIPPDPTGLRWRMHGGAVLFDGVRRYPMPFAAFVRAVEIRRTIQHMNDYIGGSAVTVGNDATGRVIRQIERNLYLPQPNYTILFGGEIIDVTKIEAIDYADRRQRMAWKTVRSANDSAIADDGIVTFEALGDDTLVTIWGKQLFRLPPLLAAIDLDLFPALKHALVTDAYRRFFRRTFANLEAVAEGRDVRIGRAWPEADEPLPVERLTEVLTAIGQGGDHDLLAWGKALANRAGAEPEPLRTDDDGFRHFQGAPPVAAPSGGRWMGELLADLRQAARIDAGMAA